MTCPNPIDAAVLADYWLGALPDEEERSVEEHLFGCDQCGDRLREVIAIANGIRELAQAGVLLMVVSDAFLKRAAGQGLHIREYAPPREAASTAPSPPKTICSSAASRRTSPVRRA